MNVNYPAEHRPPQPKRHRLRWILAGAGAVIIALIAVGAAVGSSNNGGSGKADKTATAVTTAPSTPASSTPVPPPPPVANPKGTYTGSCDYTLGSNPAGGTSTAVGEIDLHNTGNIGTIDHTKITWPQEGYSPLVMTRTVRTKAGQHKAVRFHLPMSENQISLLQSWQSGHNENSGCTYHVTITGTFGSPQGG